MAIKEVNQRQKKAWNKQASHPLQTWEWGEFRKKTGNRVLRLGVFQKGKLVQGHQITLHHLPLTNFWIGALLKGPVPDKASLKALKKIGKRERLISIRMEPDLVVAKNDKKEKGVKKFEKLFKNSGAVPGRPFFTKYTSWLNLSLPEEKQLERFHPKTRYNIKLAQRHGVRVAEDNSKPAFETYLSLLKETTKRQGFYAHTERYHRLMWETLQPAGIAHLLVAKYKNKIVSTWILFVWGDFLYYPYGASSLEHRNVMANNLMLWEAIKFGKKLGLSKFDLWGSLGPHPDPSDPWFGWHRFKSGYNPILVEFLGTWDLVVNPRLYPLVRLMEETRWKILRLRTRLPFKTPGPSFR